ncbi:MAG: hypothetical protein ACOVOX_02270, partial [Burkholderiaceae bacterium]
APAVNSSRLFIMRYSLDAPTGQRRRVGGVGNQKPTTLSQVVCQLHAGRQGSTAENEPSEG